MLFGGGVGGWMLGSGAPIKRIMHCPGDRRINEAQTRTSARAPADNRRKKICISAGTKGLRRQVWPTSAKLLSGLQKNVVRGAHGWRIG